MRIVRWVLAVVAAVTVAAGLGTAAGLGGGQAMAAVRASQLVYSEVSCRGGSFCVAVGVHAPLGRPGTSQLDLWNGRAWRAVPGPPGDLVPFGVSCSGPSFCLATVSTADPRTYRWNGRTWRLLGAQPPGYHLSCETSTFCVTTVGAEIAGWNGAHWPDMPQGSGGCGGPDCGYGPVTCGSATSCVVSGSYCDDDDCDSSTTFWQSWNGSAWTASTQPPVPDDAELACAGRSFCMSLALTARSAQAVISRDWAHNWHDASAGLTASCGRLARCGESAALSCGSSRFCMVLPSALATAPPAAALTWNGSGWTTAALAKAGGRVPDLTLLSCGSPGNCTALGTYRPAPGSRPRPVAEHWNGSAWRISQLPARA